MLCNYLNVSKCFHVGRFCQISDLDYDTISAAPRRRPRRITLGSTSLSRLLYCLVLSQCNRSISSHLITAPRDRDLNKPSLRSEFSMTPAAAAHLHPNVTPLSLLTYPHSLVISPYLPRVLHLTAADAVALRRPFRMFSFTQLVSRSISIVASAETAFVIRSLA